MSLLSSTTRGRVAPTTPARRSEPKDLNANLPIGGAWHKPSEITERPKGQSCSPPTLTAQRGSLRRDIARSRRGYPSWLAALTR